MQEDPNKPSAAVNSYMLSSAKGLIFYWSVRSVRHDT